jgi:hypothetical protein
MGPIENLAVDQNFAVVQELPRFIYCSDRFRKSSTTGKFG